MARATSPGSPRTVARLGTLLVIALIAIALLGLTISAWRSIAPGYVGIVFDKATHTVTPGAQEPGWAFINPFSQAIQQYPVTIQTYSMVAKGTEGQTSGDDSIKVQSNEGQQINLDVVIQYQVIKEEAGLLYQDWGGAEITVVEDRVVRQYTRSQVPVVASKYGWEDITSNKRGVINNEIRRQALRQLAVGLGLGLGARQRRRCLALGLGLQRVGLAGRLGDILLGLDLGLGQLILLLLGLLLGLDLLI